MEKGLLILLFLVVRFLISAYKKQKTTPTPTTPSKTTKPKGLDDVLGDFMKELEKKKSTKEIVPKTSTVLSNTDKHKAADDSRKLDWQTVDKTHLKSKEQLLKHSDYKDISHHNENVDTINSYKVEEDFEDLSLDFDEIDLRKVIIYKEIIDRKYFTV